MAQGLASATGRRWAIMVVACREETMKIATWNINGVKARLETAVAWLKVEPYDVVCFQEIKSVDEGFPGQAFEDLGYHVATHGQKGFNGVAILSKSPLEDVRRGLPGDTEDLQARYMEATVTAGSVVVRVASLYLPNGNPIATEKFNYKLAWMARLEAHTRALLEEEMPLVLAGDYNVIPMPADAARPDAWSGDALYQPESRAAWRRLITLGLSDATRACHPEPGVYTFWDYQAGAFQKNDGIRIDHLLLSPQAADRLTGAGVAKDARAMEKPSDHTPAWIELAVA
jgi:exodeoxyribonuclease III